VTELRQELRAAIEDLIQANLFVRSQLEENERLLKEALAHIDSGLTVGETLRSLPTVEERAANQGAVQVFYARRSGVRTAAIRAALAEGMTVSDLAAAFGIHHETIASHVAESAAGIDPRH